MRTVILESPFAGDIEGNLTYARSCLADCIRRGEAPIASHLLYTQPGVLDDSKPEERKKGIDAGHAWLQAADAAVFYIDRGMSSGMVLGLQRAKDAGKPVEFRSLYDLRNVDTTAILEELKNRGWTIGAGFELKPMAQIPVVHTPPINPYGSP